MCREIRLAQTTARTLHAAAAAAAALRLGGRSLPSVAVAAAPAAPAAAAAAALSVARTARSRAARRHRLGVSFALAALGPAGAADGRVGAPVTALSLRLADAARPRTVRRHRLGVPLALAFLGPAGAVFGSVNALAAVGVRAAARVVRACRRLARRRLVVRRRQVLHRAVAVRRAAAVGGDVRLRSFSVGRRVSAEAAALGAQPAEHGLGAEGGALGALLGAELVGAPLVRGGHHGRWPFARRGRIAAHAARFGTSPLHLPRRPLALAIVSPAGAIAHRVGARRRRRRRRASVRRWRRVRCAAPSAVSARARAHQRHPHAIVRALAALAPIEAVAREVVAPRPRRAPRKRPAQFARVRAAAPRLGARVARTRRCEPTGAARVVVEARLVGRLRRRRRPPRCHHRRAGRLGRRTQSSQLSGHSKPIVSALRVHSPPRAHAPHAVCASTQSALTGGVACRSPHTPQLRAQIAASRPSRAHAPGAARSAHHVGSLSSQATAELAFAPPRPIPAAPPQNAQRADRSAPSPAARRRSGRPRNSAHSSWESARVSGRSLYGARRRRRQLRAGVLDGVEQSVLQRTAQRRCTRLGGTGASAAATPAGEPAPCCRAFATISKSPLADVSRKGCRWPSREASAARLRARRVRGGLVGDAARAGGGAARAECDRGGREARVRQRSA